MENLDRRVRKLRIQSQDEGRVSSDVHALQNAFNVASLPGLPVRGLFLIRKLDLGSYPSHSSPHHISRIIDRCVQSLGYHSQCVDEGDHPQQNLVWFSDAAQAVFCLMKLVANSGSTEAWYWRPLFPSWCPGMSLAETFIATSKDFSDQQSKPFVFAQVIEQLLSQSSADTILSAVTPDFAHQQLGGSGLYPCLAVTDNNKPTRSSNLTPIISIHWQTLLQRAIADWGEQDVRSVWITFSALILHNPAINRSTSLQPMIASLIKKHSYEVAMTEITRDNLEKTVISLPRPETATATSKPDFDDRFPNLSEPRQTIQFGEAESTHAVENKTRYLPAENSSITSANRNILTGFEYSENCGLAFIIPLLEWLGMKDLLSINPEMAAINLPVRIVQSIAKRLGVADKHPVLLAMPERTEPNSDDLENFTCPPDWPALINTTKQNKILHRYKVNHSNCYITDRTKKLLLYVGDNGLPDWMASYQILDQADDYDYPRLVDLLITVQMLATRYLYRYAKISLRNLVDRKGQIASSNTHLDILFNSQQIDIHIRIAGLDIDPGWVSWCARVVQFHYTDEGGDDA